MTPQPTNQQNDDTPDNPIVKAIVKARLEARVDELKLVLGGTVVCGYHSATDTVGDTTLTYVQDGVTYGMSCGMLQVRILPGRGITCEQMHDPEQNVAKAYEIWKAQSYQAWTCFSNGSYLRYL